MKKPRKVLSLHRETLSRLNPEVLGGVHGGSDPITDSIPSCIDGCPTAFTCRPTIQ